MNNESFYMHPRYNEFLEFLKGVETESRIVPNALNLAFDVWLNAGGNMNLEQENDILRTQVMLLKRQIDGLHRERDAAQKKVNELISGIEQLTNMLAQGGAVGERGDACMSIDGANL